MAPLDRDTIAAIATAAGQGSIGVVRVSGPHAKALAEQLSHRTLTPRVAHMATLTAPDGAVIDHGLLLFFPAPHSFTGEDVVEFQLHGNRVVLDHLLHTLFAFGVRPARPGEFSERAFLNQKLDLAQAEAIADLIAASSQHAARSALSSLQGKFSTAINTMIASLVALRAYIEAALDFPEEDTDFLSAGNIPQRLETLREQLQQTLDNAKQGSLITEGMTVVIAGKPNAGKSSVLNALAERDAAIVTPIAGTTRDVLCEQIQIDGMPLHIIDTAGLRETDDPVEQEGVRRARAEIEKADRLLFIIDMAAPAAAADDERRALQQRFPQLPVTVVYNKCDLAGIVPSATDGSITLSAKLGQGMDLLRAHLKNCMGYREESAGKVSARRRHVVALQRAQQHIERGVTLLQEGNQADLLAEELRLAQQDLEVITGRFTPDDLLEKIFREFCIGK